jgi:hypothetical protein
MDGLNLRATPTLQLSAPNAAEKLDEKLTAELERVEADQSVLADRALFEKACDREKQLDRAHRALNQRDSEIGKWLGDIAGTYVESLIESAGSDGKRPDVKIAGRIIDSENESRLICRAIERIALHLKPVAEIARLRAEAQMQHTRAKVIDELAHERAQRFVGALSAAVGEEVAVSVDTKSGAIGMLLAIANEARKEAYGLEAFARERQESYDKHNAKGQN